MSLNACRLEEAEKAPLTRPDDGQRRRVSRFACHRPQAGPETSPPRCAMAELTANGAQLAFDDRGEGSPAFLFVHGWACDRSGWDAQIENLSRDHRCVEIGQA